MPGDETSQDEGGWAGVAEDRRNRTATDAMIQARLAQVLAQQRELRDDLRRLREDLTKQGEAGSERSFLIRRIDERVNELFARIAVIEANYVKKEDYAKTVEPIKKWGTWLAMAVIGSVLTAVLGMVLNKGGIPH